MSDKFETDYALFDPLKYLQQYSSAKVLSPEDPVLSFHARMAQKHGMENALVMDFGCGPSIYASISLAHICAEIHMSDFLERNLDQIRLWLERHEQAYDWDNDIRLALASEIIAKTGGGIGQPVISSADIKERGDEIRRKVTRLLPCDARNAHPVGPEGLHCYDIVVSAFCLEAVSNDLEEWRQVVANISTLLKSGGQLILTSTAGTDGYRVDGSVFATACISEDLLRTTLLETGYDSGSIWIESSNFEDQDAEQTHINGIIMCSARKT